MSSVWRIGLVFFASIIVQGLGVLTSVSSSQSKEGIMSKTALVLSGGGAKGAFQFAAEKYVREVKGYHWDIIAGVSVGALNGSMIAMKKYERLEELWNTITRQDIMTGQLNLWAILKMIFGAKSIYGNQPLAKLIEDDIEGSQVDCDLRIGAVSLTSGEYIQFKKDDPGFQQAVLASTAIPIIWPPVEQIGAQTQLVDGGVRNVSPLGDVLDAEPDEIVIINCSPQTTPPLTSSLRNALEIGMRSIDLVTNEVFMGDVREFLRINHNVKQAGDKVVLTNDKGKPYKYYEAIVIEPESPIGDTLDFSRETLEMRMQAGRLAAEKAFSEKKILSKEK
jgi:NTE family protein